MCKLGGVQMFTRGALSRIRVCVCTYGINEQTYREIYNIIIPILWLCTERDDVLTTFKNTRQRTDFKPYATNDYTPGINDVCLGSTAPRVTPLLFGGVKKVCITFTNAPRRHLNKCYFVHLVLI